MRNEKVLIKVLRSLVDVLGDEAARNPAFAERLDAVLHELKSDRVKDPKPRSSSGPEPELPDIHAEWSKRGETDFRLWLRDQPVAMLRALIRSQDFDPTRRTAKWKEAEKLAAFITDGLRARMAKGSSFLQREGEA